MGVSKQYSRGATANREDCDGSEGTREGGIEIQRTSSSGGCSCYRHSRPGKRTVKLHGGGGEDRRVVDEYRAEGEERGRRTQGKARQGIFFDKSRWDGLNDG